jgi:hypothetical protein
VPAELLLHAQRIQQQLAQSNPQAAQVELQTVFSLLPPSIVSLPEDAQVMRIHAAFQKALEQRGFAAPSLSVPVQTPQ